MSMKPEGNGKDNVKVSWCEDHAVLTLLFNQKLRIQIFRSSQLEYICHPLASSTKFTNKKKC